MHEPSRAPAPLTTRDGWQRLTSFDGTSLAWRATGDGSGLPLVLCNGISCDDGYWHDIVPPLAADRPVVRWHYRGHGLSDPPADPANTSVDAVVRDLIVLLDALELDRVVLSGHSYGVQIALETALRHRARVAGVVAVAGSPCAPFGRAPGRLAFGPMQRLLGAAPDLSRSAWTRLWSLPAAYWVARAVRGTTRLAPRAVMDDYFRHVAQRDLDVLLPMLASMLEHSAMESLPDLACPLLAIAGAADALTPLEMMTAMAVRGRGELVVVPGGAHTLPAEQPQLVAGHMRPFLARLDRT